MSNQLDSKNTKSKLELSTVLPTVNREQDLEKALSELLKVCFTEYETRLSLICGTNVTNVSNELNERCDLIGIARKKAKILLNSG